MKLFIPVDETMLGDILPDDRLVPYQVAWSEYLEPVSVSMLDKINSMRALEQASTANEDSAITRHPA